MSTHAVTSAALTGIRVRPYRADDTETLHTLLRESLVLDDQPEQVLTLLARPLPAPPAAPAVTSPLAGPSRHIVVAESPSGRAVGVCSYSTRLGVAQSTPLLEPRSATTKDLAVRGHIDLIATSPQGRGVGAAMALLDHAENALREYGCAEVSTQGHGPYYAWPGVDARYLSALCLFQTRGYRKSGAELNLRCPLNTDEPLTNAATLAGAHAGLARQGLTMRPVEPVDLARLREAISAAWKHTWVDEILGSAQLPAAESRPGGAFLVEDTEGSIVAFCGYGLNRSFDVGPMGTDPSVRNQGIGRALLLACLDAQRAAGLPYAEVQWAGPLRYFSRTLAAETSRTFLVLTKPLTAAATDAREAGQ